MDRSKLYRGLGLAVLALSLVGFVGCAADDDGELEEMDSAEMGEEGVLGDDDTYGAEGARPGTMGGDTYGEGYGQPMTADLTQGEIVMIEGQRYEIVSVDSPDTATMGEATAGQTMQVTLQLRPAADMATDGTTGSYDPATAQNPAGAQRPGSGS